MATINQRLTRLEVQSFRASLLRSADLDLEDNKYSQLQTDFGTVLVSVRKVEAHLDGVQVTLRIGNPLDVTFHGFKIKTQWGERPPSGDDVAATDRWQAQLQSKEITLTDDLYPGSWTDVVVSLSPATTEHFGYLNIEAPQFDELRLRMSP